jgi:glutamine amidotransferase
MGGPRVLVVDYGMGNLRSVAKALERVGARVLVSGRPEDVADTEKLVLPGVGAFAAAIAGLRQRGLLGPLRLYLQENRPFLGICLGLQLLFERSHEEGEHEGLGLLRGDVVRFLPDDRALKVPHIGWNQVHLRPGVPLFAGVPQGAYVYFVHSYYVRPQADVVAAETDYGSPFCSAIWRGHLSATQFHPEKSQKVGLQMLANFVSS